jgi:hypothetical protein
MVGSFLTRLNRAYEWYRSLVPFSHFDPELLQLLHVVVIVWPLPLQLGHLTCRVFLPHFLQFAS